MTKISQGHFEAKKHGYRQTQEGIVVSFVVHPDEMSNEGFKLFALAALGTQYMVGFAQILADGKPASAGDPPSATEAGEARTPFGQLKLAQQAGMRCNDRQFQIYLNALNPESAKQAVYIRCGVNSRADIVPGSAAAGAWLLLEQQFQDWLTSQRYGKTG